jgi:putative phosphoesterase
MQIVEGSPNPVKRSPESQARRWLRRVPAALIITSVSLGGLALVPAVTSSVGPTVVSARSKLGKSSTTLRVPPLGTVSAATHRAPLTLEIGIDEVDVEELGRLATSVSGRAELRQRIEADLAALARRAALRSILGAALLGALTALVLFHRHWLWVASGVGLGALSTLAMIAATASTYQVAAFENPTFSGPITRARSVIEAIAERVELLDEARSRYRIAAERMSDLFVVLGTPSRDPRQSETVLLHVSDIHANLLAFDYIQELVSEFDVDAVVDTGDISSSELDTGELSSLAGPLDDATAGEIRQLRVPYIFVSGNHDSPAMVNRLSRVSNVRVLDKSLASVAGIDIFGSADPTYSTSPIPEAQKSEMRAAEAPEVAEALREQDADLLLVHDRVLGQDATGDVSVLLSGHTHEGEMQVVDGTIVLTVGSSGATGLKSLTVEADRTYDAELLYFDGEDLVAVDYVRFESLNGDFVLERTTF